MNSEEYCHWVSSHGIAKSCDYFIKTIKDFDNFLVINEKNIFFNGAVIYLHVEHIPLLVRYIDFITFSFILVSKYNNKKHEK